MPRLVRVPTTGGKPEVTTAGAMLIAALAWAAGVVNATGYLAFGSLFTSHMTGNASSAVLALVAGRGDQTAARILVIAAFFVGALGGALLVERHRSRSAAGALWVEAALLVAAVGFASDVVLDGWARDLELAGIAAAMGVQNIALAGSAISAHTTHITGPLTDFAGTLVRRLVGRRELARDRSHGLIVYGGRVLAFVIGVACGGALFSAIGAGALLFPCAVVATSGAVVWHATRLYPSHVDAG
jgi:uncharacterized membrane protein YoaK (UPF0700 family)